MRCNLTEAEQKAALEVPFRCTGEEQEFIERCFIGYLFFEHEADENGRLGVTTECTRCGRKVWWTEREWKRFKQENDVKARSNLLCPDCGCGVTLYPRGRLRNGNTLDEYRQVVLLRAIDGALRAVALGVWKHHGRWESDDAECCVKAAYYFAQGKCQKWRREWGWSEEEQKYTPRLVAQKTMTEPFAKCDSWICRRIGDYAIHGVDQIAASPLRYCAAEQFFKLDGDDPRENTEGLLTYLGLWTRYPRIEQLAKAGCEKIINDAIQGSMNSRALNWRAKTMPAFFGVDKPTVKRLLAGGIGQKELEALELVRHGGVTPEEALTICGRIGDKTSGGAATRRSERSVKACSCWRGIWKSTNTRTRDCGWTTSTRRKGSGTTSRGGTWLFRRTCKGRTTRPLRRSGMRRTRRRERHTKSGTRSSRRSTAFRRWVFASWCRRTTGRSSTRARRCTTASAATPSDT